MKILFLSLFVMLAGCTAKQVDPVRSSKKLAGPSEIKPAGPPAAATTPPARPLNADDDTIAIPNAIAGSHLTCAVRKEATDKSLEAEIGCLLSETAGGKKLGVDAKLSLSSSQPNLVNAELQPASSIYHVLYRVKGESRDAILQTTQALDAIALYSEKAFKTERITKVLKPAIALDDYEAPVVREQAIDKDDDGSL